MHQTELRVHNPDLLRLHQQDPDRYPHLLESVSGGRYDILFAFPGDSLILDQKGLHGHESSGGEVDFIAALDAWFLKNRRARKTELPFEGGWFLYLAYELAAQIEPVLDLPPDPSGLPVAMATYFPAAIIRDREADSLHIVAEEQHHLDQINHDITNLNGETPDASPVTLRQLDEEEGDRYLQGVASIKDYIVEGDVFQVNLSRPWRGVLSDDIPHGRLYAALRASNPAPFAALATLGAQAVISSSPERLIRVEDRLVETRPIAGTRPRDDDLSLDEALSNELLAHPKERAEHIMLIDLERNDLGRICTPGSVEVNELMVLESYQHVHHIVSNVRGMLREDVTPGQVIRAVFPGGTITGCPKIRCMEIIDEMELEGRGAYTGSLGYLNAHGGMDLNILIRTLVRSGDQVRFRTGAGIVADSDPVRELEETRHKAQGLLRGFAL